MSLPSKTGALLLAAGLAAAAPAHAATLQPGVFYGLAAITSETGVLCGYVSLPPSVQFSLIYPGASQPGGNVELLVPGSTSFSAFGISLPTTPAAGITAWTGPVSVSIPGFGPFNGTVVIAGTAADTTAFTGTIALNVGPGYCTINIGVAGTHAGHI